MRQVLLISCVCLLGAVNTASAGTPSSCPPWRPCGPGNSWGGNRLIGQGFRDVDFRPACQGHDTCLEAGCSPKACDRKFRDDMFAACANSARPGACRRKARMYYLATRIVHMFEG